MPHTQEIRTGYIYALVDPRDTKVRYVGQTTRTLQARFQEHLNGGLACNPSAATRKERWIGQLGCLNLRPILRVLEQPPLSALDARERSWQHWYARQQRMTVVGQGFLVPSLGHAAPVWTRGY